MKLYTGLRWEGEKKQLRARRGENWRAKHGGLLRLYRHDEPQAKAPRKPILRQKPASWILDADCLLPSMIHGHTRNSGPLGLVYAYSRYATPRKAFCHSPPEGPWSMKSLFAVLGLKANYFMLQENEGPPEMRHAASERWLSQCSSPRRANVENTTRRSRSVGLGSQG